MTWARLDDVFPAHRKVRRLSDGAFRLHVTAICFAAHDLTDGLITHSDLDELVSIRSADKRIDELVRAALWEPVAGGWLIHDFLHYNPSKAQVEADREAARERQRRRRERRESAGSHAVSHAVTPPEVTAGVRRESQHPDPTRPDPTRPDPLTTEKDVPRKRGTRLPEDFALTDEMRAWAQTTAPWIDVDWATAKFVDYWTAMNGQKATKVDWIKTWRNWIRGEVDRTPESKRGNGTQSSWSPWDNVLPVGDPR